MSQKSADLINIAAEARNQTSSPLTEPAVLLQCSQQPSLDPVLRQKNEMYTITSSFINIRYLDPSVPGSSTTLLRVQFYMYYPSLKCVLHA
jgi:hypothetical protein